MYSVDEGSKKGFRTRVWNMGYLVIVSDRGNEMRGGGGVGDGENGEMHVINFGDVYLDGLYIG